MSGLNDTEQAELDKLLNKEELTEQELNIVTALLRKKGVSSGKIQTAIETMLKKAREMKKFASSPAQVKQIEDILKKKRKTNKDLRIVKEFLDDIEKNVTDARGVKGEEFTEADLAREKAGDAAVERLKNPKKSVDDSAMRTETKEQPKPAKTEESAPSKIPSGGPEVPPKQPRGNERAEGSPAGAPLVKLQVKNRKKEPLPQLEYPSTTIVLAKKFSGKTNLLLNIVDKSKFDNVWVVSLTGFTGKLDGLCEDEDCLLEDISDEMINELLKMHKEDRMQSLIIFDDVIGQVDMRSKGMVKLATMGRNFGISIIISSQDFFRVPPVWRRNTEYWYLGSMTDSNIDAVAKELSTPTFQKKRIKQELSNVARDKNHDWLFYNDRKTNFRKLFGTQFKVIV